MFPHAPTDDNGGRTAQGVAPMNPSSIRRTDDDSHLLAISKSERHEANLFKVAVLPARNVVNDVGVSSRPFVGVCDNIWCEPSPSKNGDEQTCSSSVNAPSRPWCGRRHTSPATDIPRSAVFVGMFLCKLWSSLLRGQLHTAVQQHGSDEDESRLVEMEGE